MNKLTLTAVSVAVVVSAVAGPKITVDGAAQAANRLITINYALADEDAIVTVDVQTNFTDGAETKWASIGAENFTNIGGDVNRLVKTGARKALWRPDKSWPDRELAAGKMRFVVNAWTTSAPPDYLVAELDGSKTVRYYESAAALPDGGLTNDIYRTDRLVLRKCPAANVTWWMGAPSDEMGFEQVYPGYDPAAHALKETRHQVTLSHDYYIGVFEMTQGQAEKVGYKYNQSKFKTDKAVRPMENLYMNVLRGDKNGCKSWPDADIEKARVVDGAQSIVGLFRIATDLTLDLPTEAQWEFACRAGCGTGLNNGTQLANNWIDATTVDANLAVVARYFANAGAKSSWTGTEDLSQGTARVGTYPANAWGLYDMHGNVTELCLDRRVADLGAADVVDPVGDTDKENNMFVTRGGSFVGSKYNRQECRSAARRETYNDGWQLISGVGARLCLTLE